MNRLSILIPVAVSFLFLNGETARGQEYTLRYAFPPDREMKYKKFESTDAHVAGPGGLEEKIRKKTETIAYISGIKTDPDLVGFIYRQDTVFTDDESGSRTGFSISDVSNALNNKRILVHMTPRGDPVRIEPLDHIVIDQSSPINISDTLLARQAALFPALPPQKVRMGESWTESRADTTRPTYTLEGIGKSEGLTIQSSTTRYSIEDRDVLQGRECLKLTWKSTIRRESEMIAGGIEVYSEDETHIAGTMYFDPATGILVTMETKSITDSANAMISDKDNTVMPSSSINEMTLTFIPKP